MPICHKNKFIFFHIPRCGGTSLGVYFQFHRKDQLYGVINNGKQTITIHHLTPTDLKHSQLVNDDILQSYFKFTIIRDPFDRMISDFLWQKKYDKYNIFTDMSFDDYLQFAERIIEEGRYFEKQHFDHFRPMIMYCVNNDQLLVDDILLLENIAEELDRISDRIGNVNITRINQSFSDNHHLRTTANIDKVYRLYEPDKVLYDRVASLNNI